MYNVQLSTHHRQLRGLFVLSIVTDINETLSVDSLYLHPIDHTIRLIVASLNFLFSPSINPNPSTPPSVTIWEQAEQSQMCNASIWMCSPSHCNSCNEMNPLAPEGQHLWISHRLRFNRSIVDGGRLFTLVVAAGWRPQQAISVHTQRVSSTANRFFVELPFRSKFWLECSGIPSP